jgi:hypothetical protein
LLVLIAADRELSQKVYDIYVYFGREVVGDLSNPKNVGAGWYIVLYRSAGAREVTIDEDKAAKQLSFRSATKKVFLTVPLENVLAQGPFDDGCATRSNEQE